MKLTWMDVRCPHCGYVWNIRAPKVADIAKAHAEGKVVCLKCGKRPVLDLPVYAELQRDGVEEAMFGVRFADKKKGES